MSAFVIADIEVLDAVPYEDYKRLAAQSIALYGGRYVVRGGRAEWEPSRLVMLEFPSVERAIAWYESAEYATARELRRTSARLDMVVVEGLGEWADEV
jgi:uncharacterized protein (DUF1330 family)